MMQFRFYNKQRALVAKGSQTGLFIDTKTLRPKRLTADARASFTAYLASTADV
ncbi:MAG: hypothetical protein AAF773_19695 [Cyanobacteria bacterium P01_D01_bin.115]